MDINLPAPKNQRCFECVDMIDWISKLPDEILGKILNYLPTKQAVATSILSERWEYLWTLTSDLDFSDGTLDDSKNENAFMIKTRCFQKYVDRVMFYHGGSNIRKCRIIFYTKYVASSVYTWICALITCNIKELSLYYSDFKFNTYSHLPQRLFSCNTLVVLKICGNFVVDLPTYVCFPCLKLLHIKNAVLVDDASVERLFSSCPVLEELNIQRRLNCCLHTMNISVPSLKRLYIYNGRIQTKINTPRLEYLQIYNYASDAPSRTYFANFTSSLVRAELQGIDIFLLKAISQVEYLILAANDMSLENIVRDSALPIFKNLKTLKFHVGGIWSKPNDWKVLPNLLDSSPNLQLLILDHFYYLGLLSANINLEDFNYFNWQRPESESSNMNLKTIEIFKFVGFPIELQLAEYLLERATVLEKMIIHRFDISQNSTLEKKVKGDKALSELLRLRRSCSLSEVMSFKRSSSTCQVIFTD